MLNRDRNSTMNNFTDINFVANLVGLTPNTCPDCAELITADNPLIDPERYSTQFGSCVGCCDPTPFYPDLG
jgi:hypothetical protein